MRYIFIVTMGMRAHALRKGKPILPFRTGNSITNAGQLLRRPSCDKKDITIILGKLNGKVLDELVNTVAQKTAPMFAHLSMIALV